MKEVPSNSLPTSLSFLLPPYPSYNLPHHGVQHHAGLSSKLRVVFNGSCKTSTGTSLNDVLHSGSKLQIDLIEVLLWFRTFRYVFSTDIEKMYRQVMTDPDDHRFQRILWKDNTGILLTFELTTVTYGLRCAPFLALRTLNQLVLDESHRFPLAVPPMTKARYIDDILGGGDSIEEIRDVACQVNQLCQAGGFPLHKWAANNPAILQGLPGNRLLTVDLIEIDSAPSISTLGLLWQPSEGEFHFSSISNSSLPSTKQNILSMITRLFDPLGLIAPVILHAKCILQEL